MPKGVCTVAGVLFGVGRRFYPFPAPASNRRSRSYSLALSR